MRVRKSRRSARLSLSSHVGDGRAGKSHLHKNVAGEEVSSQMAEQVKEKKKEARRIRSEATRASCGMANGKAACKAALAAPVARCVFQFP